MPVVETAFSHRFTAYRIVGNFFGLSYLNRLGNNQVKNSFFRISNISVPCPHAQLRGRTVIKKVMDIFRTLGSGSASVTAMSDFSCKANTSIHGQGEDDTASPALGRHRWNVLCSLVVKGKLFSVCHLLNNVKITIGVKHHRLSDNWRCTRVYYMAPLESQVNGTNL